MLKAGRSASEEPSGGKPLVDNAAEQNGALVSDSVRNAFAFTIDFGDGKKPVDAQRHEKMLERFQARHKRGVSLSKLESCSNSPAGSGRVQQGARAPGSVNLPRRNNKQPQQTADAPDQMRTVGRGDGSATKRHSWSPRTSMSEMGGGAKAAQPTGRSNNAANRFAPKSATLALALEQQQQQVGGGLEGKDYSYSSSEFTVESLGSCHGGIPCLEAPLENFRKSRGDGVDGEEEDDDVSEAGTYTIDGANYTEEQKERMNIDRIGPAGHVATLPPEVVDPVPVVQPAPVRPTDFREELEVIDLERTTSSGKQVEGVAPESRKHNILEGMESIGLTAPELDSPDQGTFTSVTTSGILSVKPTLLEGGGGNAVPGGQRRRNSLTKSHIDSSEYVQGVAKSKGKDVHPPDEERKILNCYTDSEKAHHHQGGGAHQRLQAAKKGDASPVGGRRKTPSDVAALTSVATKKDWIQEWAKNAREYSKTTSPKGSEGEELGAATTRRSRSNQFGYDFDIDLTKSDYYEAKRYEEFGDNLDHRQHYRGVVRGGQHSTGGGGSDPLFARTGSRGSMRRYGHNQHPSPVTPSAASKPPMSPSKIPSPIGSIGRARSDLSGNETEMYLQKTAAAISTLQNLQRRNSLRNSSSHHSSSPLSPASRKMSPKEMELKRRQAALMADSVMPRPRAMSLGPRKTPGSVQPQHLQTSTGAKQAIGANQKSVAVNRVQKIQPQSQQQQQHLTSPIKRSSSFSVKPLKPATPTMSAKAGGLTGVNGRTVSSGGSRIQKSASSTSFKKMAAGVSDSGDGYSSNSLSDEEDPVDDLDDEDLDVNGGRLEKEPLTNTRYNKTFLMRMEQNKKLAGGAVGGAAACPNTPELPRRAVQMRGVGGLGRDRASMPRDSSLNRMKQDLNMRKSATGREMLLGGKGQQHSTQSINSTASSAVGAGGKVQPKYLDISKYKSSNAANFLKKDESKSYLLRNQEGVRKSPSSASVSSAMSRTDPTRMSARSVKSASSAASKSSAAVKVAKEQELEMWRRRASYDPMKAALEGKKKQQEESRRQLAAQQQQQQQSQLHSERQSKSSESSVLRSQSYHSGVGNIATGGRLYQGNVGNSSNVNLRGAYNQTLGEQPESGSDNRWTLTSTESSEDLDGDDYIN
ncbi:AGAP011070-PA [Anopheles gambiae str. PEST]|uniref:AGAP011070-PA n=1 Tax=Anopheles gambiae TaxID=7165 RepID=A0NBT6_ANOGA|nr:AGAP011070-PA [Anopheles gambiae str. PEST]